MDAVESAVEFPAVFKAEFSYVLHSLRRLGVRERDLEDVTHDVFVTVYKRLADYDPTRPIRPWLFGTAFRHASDYRRLARNQREVLDDDNLGVTAVDESAGAEQQLVESEQRALVLSALEGLDLDRRAVLVMHDIDGHAIPVVAAALSIPLNTAYSRLRLAREQFRGEVERLRRKRGER